MSPGDRCACGHTRNHHNRYGLGRCLAAGCGCTRQQTVEATR
jgi:hypothetical protein